MLDRSRRVILLIDYDNLQICAARDTPGRDLQLDPVVQLAQKYGTIVVARAYAEWNLSTERLAVYKAGVEPAFAPVLRTENDRSGKSLADTVMVAEGMDMLWTLSPDVMVLATSDKDLIPLARVAKQRGARVVVIGSDLTAIPLREMADEHVTYKQLINESAARLAEFAPGRQAATAPEPVRRARPSRDRDREREPRETREQRESREQHEPRPPAQPTAAAPAAAAPATPATPVAPVAAPAEGEAAGSRRRRRRGSRRRSDRLTGAEHDAAEAPDHDGETLQAEAAPGTDEAPGGDVAQELVESGTVEAAEQTQSPETHPETEPALEHTASVETIPNGTESAIAPTGDVTAEPSENGTEQAPTEEVPPKRTRRTGTRRATGTSRRSRTESE